jgi:hypothetical protein
VDFFQAIKLVYGYALSSGIFAPLAKAARLASKTGGEAKIPLEERLARLSHNLGKIPESANAETGAFSKP